MRGLVMVIMVLDHVRSLFHADAITQNPSDLGTTTYPVFFTRWITHLCAPAFVFLAGTSAFLTGLKLGDSAKLKSYLFARGAMLVVLEFTVVNFAIWFDVDFSTILFEVIAAIGFSFIVLAFLIDVKPNTILISGVAIIVMHQLVTFIPMDGFPIARQVLGLLFQPGAIPLGEGRIFVIGYPLVPWLGILLVGYGSANIFLKPDHHSRILKTGVLCLLLFIGLRIINVYGDPALWSPQKSIGFTILSFINVSKYPPSLLFCLLTLGIIFVLTGLSKSIPQRLTMPLQHFGRVPLFFFIVHLYIIHVLLIAWMFLQGYRWTDLNFGPLGFGRPSTGEGGVSLSWVYAIWALIVLILYPMCRSYYSFRKEKKQVIEPVPRH